ncbi:MAG: hypothetical protein WKF57_08100 [Nakamurella sp.]
MTDPTLDDDVVDAQLSRHFAAATSSFAPPQQLSIVSLLPARSPRNRWWAPAAVAGGLIAAATATVLVVSSTAPSSAPKVGVAPSGPSATGSTSNDGGGEPAAQITVSGQEYTLGGAVPWYSAMRIGNTVAVSTGPEIRGACNTQIYRLGATHSPNGDLVLTSYQYNPPKDQAQPSCAAIGLPPYVAAFQLEEEPPLQVLDGARSSEGAQPLTHVLVPTELPAGFAPGGTDPEFGQQPDPDRPGFNAYRSFFENTDGQNEGAIGQNFSSGTQSLTVTQGLQAFSSGYDTLDRTTIGPYPATVNAFQDAPERCVRWTDDAAGKVEVCGTVDGGADAVVAVARSIYAASPTDPSTSSGAPSTDADARPAELISISGREFALVGAVPWYSAVRVGNTVAVTTGPKVRGACDTDVYRLTAITRAGRLILTSYQYRPVIALEPTACVDIGLSPFVATLALDSTPPATAEDGARTGSRATPFPILLKPRVLPQGFVEGTSTQSFPQIHDPERPVFPPYAVLDDGTVVQTFRSGSAVLIVRQGVKRSTPTANGSGSITVGPYPATLVTSKNGVQHCARWTDEAAGGAEVCGNVPADTVLAVANSIYR